MLAFALTAASAPAGLVAYEPFGPTGGSQGNLLSQAATGTGFSGVWTQSSADSGSTSYVLRTSDSGTFANGWPANVSTPSVASLADLLAAARAVSPTAAAAANHVEALYQGAGSGRLAGAR